MHFSDLADQLYQQVLAVNNPAITGEALKEQLERARVSVALTNSLVGASRLVLDAQKAKADFEYGASIPKELAIEKYK